MWGMQLGAFVPMTGNWQHKMCSLDQWEELLLQSIVLLALGLEELARICLGLATCLIFSEGQLNIECRVCVSPAAILTRLST